jgi:hypothetical protein
MLGLRSTSLIHARQTQARASGPTDFRDSKATGLYQ